MKLHQLNYSCCPTCEQRAVAWSQRHRHANGQWFETIEFDCGCHIWYEPNLKKERVVTPCPNSFTERNKQAKRTMAMGKLQKYIRRLDVDDEFKKETEGFWCTIHNM